MLTDEQGQRQVVDGAGVCCAVLLVLLLPLLLPLLLVGAAGSEVCGHAR